MKPRYQAIPARAIRVPVPDVLQKREFSCGPAALMAAARYFGCGPNSEEAFIAAVGEAGMDPRVGAHPHHLEEAARRLKLKARIYQPMTVKQLRGCLRQARPVLLTMQAWAEEGPIDDYREAWNQGHWIVAIGFDRTGVYFEDPLLEAERGYLAYEELDARWHDTGPYGQRLDHLGLALWKPGKNSTGYLRRARYLD